MKPMPPDPTVYTPGAERWFDRHEHAGAGPADMTKTLTAMRLVVYDRMRLPLPDAARKFSIGELELFGALHKKLGSALMQVWRTSCVYIQGDDPEAAFKNLLSGKGLKHE